MSVLDRFLNAMKLNDDEEEFDDSEYLDDADDAYDEPRVKQRYIRTRDEDEADEPEDDLAAAIEPKDSITFKSKQPASAPKQVRSSKISPMRPRRSSSSSSGMEVCVIKPKSMEDAKEITDTLLAECTVLLNMEGLDLDIAQRIIDYACGSCYALSGKLQKISNYIFIIAPSAVDISGDFQEILSGAFDVPSFEKRF